MFALFLSLSVEFWWFFEDQDPLKRARLRAPALQTPPKFHEKTPKERQKERKWGERGKKRAKFWAPHTLRSLGLAPPF